MGRYVTPLGVEIETSERAARAIGYKPVGDKAPQKKAAAKKKDEPSNQSDPD